MVSNVIAPGSQQITENEMIANNHNEQELCFRIAIYVFEQLSLVWMATIHHLCINLFC